MDTKDPVLRQFPAKVRPVVMVAAGVALHCTYGIVYTFGNLLPYLVSYLRWKVNPDQTVASLFWLQSLLTGVPFAMLTGGFLEKKLGARAGAVLGSALFSGGIALSYFTVQHSFWALILSFGLIASAGQGIAYNCVLILAQKWMPERVGLASGLITAGFGSCAFVVSPIQTKFINPDNYAAGEDGFFHQEDLLNRVPQFFLFLAALFGIVQSIALCFLGYPIPPAQKVVEEVTEKDKDLEATNQTALLAGVAPPPSAASSDLTPKDVLSSPTFWLYTFTLFFNVMWVQVTSGLFKSFGMTFVDDDFFMAVTNSVAAACNCLSRVVWGVIVDHSTYRTCMSVVCVMGATLMWTLTLVKTIGSRYLYFAWICAMFTVIGATFSLIPTAIHRTFGSANFGIAYGVTQNALPSAGIVAATLTQILLARYNFEKVFLLFGSCMVISFILTHLIRFTRHGQGAQERPRAAS